MINETQFMELIADVLEIEPEEINLSTDYREDIEDWDSLKGFMIISNIDEELDVFIEVEAFEEMKTIGDLYDYVKKANGE